ncbi:MAG: ATP-dependent sacrificial sulfur transferase LarE [Firmicutes bacterium]|nr:ATP-dependent sacrificial sulfur transferase LarE [Bacillota bacterium]
MTLDQKLNKLKNILNNYENVLIAFSGGVDSTLLLKVATMVLPKNNVLSVTAVSDTYTKEELQLAKGLAAEVDVEHIIIESNEMEDKKFNSNPPERCYYCKYIRFNKLKELARNRGINYVLDGANIDDLSDYRPGSKAVQELDVKSPLQEAQLTKNEIRDLSRELGLKTWNIPSVSCLASRISYGDPISKEKLLKIKNGEDYLKSLNFYPCRLRHHGNLARIEIPVNKFNDFTSRARDVYQYFEKLGYTYVTLDIMGLRSGSMNETIKER